MTGNLDHLLARFVPDADHRILFWQVARFGIAGVGLTALVAVLYTAQVYLLRVQPNLATTIAIIIATFPGYFLHSHFSFAGHGARDAHTAHIRTLRFAVTSLVGFASNNLGTWTLVSLLHEPKWTPNLFFLFVTPVVTFALNRKWVFA